MKFHCRVITLLVITLGSWSGGSICWGQSPSDVELLSSQGEHFKAVVTFEKLPKRRIISSTLIAYAKSCWALGLLPQAMESFTKALNEPALPEIDQGRILLSLGIIEFQEGRFQSATIYADRAFKAFPVAGSLRAKVLLLSGTSLLELANPGAAEQKLQQALNEGSDADTGDILFQLGEAQYRLNRLDDAAKSFEGVPLNYQGIPQAIRRLAEISLIQGRNKEAGFWLDKGTADYRESFLDSWVEYARAVAAMGTNDTDRMRKIRVEANNRFPASDSWMSLLNASAERFEWQKGHGLIAGAPNSTKRGGA